MKTGAGQGRYADQNVFITGGSSGIGLAAADAVGTTMPCGRKWEAVARSVRKARPGLVSVMNRLRRNQSTRRRIQGSYFP